MEKKKKNEKQEKPLDLQEELRQIMEVRDFHIGVSHELTKHQRELIEELKTKLKLYETFNKFRFN